MFGNDTNHNCIYKEIRSILYSDISATIQFTQSFVFPAAIQKRNIKIALQLFMV
jgi:hypothetical protein